MTTTLFPRFSTLYKEFRSDAPPFLSDEHVLISEHILSGIRETIDLALEHSELDPNDLYVVCPQYKDNFTGNLADCQLTITGTPHFDEHPDDSALREIQEEIGFIPSNLQQTICLADKWNRPVFNFLTRIDDETHLFPQFFPEHDSVFENRDDKSRKIQIFAFGRKQDLESLLQETLYPLPSNDTIPSDSNRFFISGIRLISLPDVLDAMEFISLPR